MTILPSQRGIGPIPWDTHYLGDWHLHARAPYKTPQDVSFFRGAPIKLGSFSFADPFGPSDLQIQLPQVTLYDAIGTGDLDWIAPGANLDLIWGGSLPSNYSVGTRTSAFRWEGYIVRYDQSSEGTTIQAKGALRQLDDWLAKPEYTGRPLPYEWAIARQFLGRPSLRTDRLDVVWPDWWTMTYQGPAANTALAGVGGSLGVAKSSLIPAGVSVGQKWTGLLTRSTGQWEPVLTGYIGGLLASMYSERGRWTMDLDANRRPLLFHRDFVTGRAPGTVLINPRDPGVKISLAQDWEQTLTTIYGQGNSLSGVAYTGMQVSVDGSRTSYIPLAAQRQVWPYQNATGSDLWFDEQVMEREALVQMQNGLSEDDAAIVARTHLARFAEPGSVGTIELSNDAFLVAADGHTLQPIPPFMVRAGMDVVLPMVGGRPEGVIVHVSESTADFAANSVSLTVDTKARDALTVAEVKARGRDSLSISRMLVAGSYAPVVPDQLYPWSYTSGSGYIPDSLHLFAGMPDSVIFPWTDWTTARPPSSAQWSASYIHLGPASANANNNWAVQRSSWGANMGIPVLAAQAGQIRLLQIAAYDRDGNVLRVPFHVSFYYLGSVNVSSMPAIPVEQASLFAPYKAGQHYPFVRDAFEEFLRDGTKPQNNAPSAYSAAGPVRIYGTYYEKAGFWPGSYAEGDEPTGMLVDEAVWSFDISAQGDAIFDPYSSERNLTNPHSGHIYAMIYCDAQVTDDVYFLGRMFRVEPTGASGA